MSQIHTCSPDKEEESIEKLTFSEAYAPNGTRILSWGDRQLVLGTNGMPYGCQDPFWKLIPRYLEEMYCKQLSESYIRENARLLKWTRRLFETHRKSLNPKKFNQEEVMFFLNNLNGKPKYKEQCYMVFRQFLSFCGNDVAKKMNIRFPRDTTSNADWLDPDQIPIVRKFARNPLEKLLMELGFNNGARRIECLRMTKKDALDCIETGILTLKGKGPMGGKTRSFGAHPDTRGTLIEYLKWRNELIQTKAKRNYTEPSELFIYVKGGRPQAYKRPGLEKILSKLSERTGIHFSYHTMRRSFGRQMHRAGAPITAVQKILGHESIEMTIRYLGLNIDDTLAAMTKLAEYQHKNGFK